MFDWTEAEKHLKPEAAARLREIGKTCAELQVEAAGIMRDEAERLSTDEETEMQARDAIGHWFGALAVGNLSDAAEEFLRPEM